MTLSVPDHLIVEALQLLCGVFFLPHIVSKISDRAPSIELFTAAGLRSALPWVWAAIFVEMTVSAGLLLDVYARICAAVGALFLLAAAIVILRVSGGAWRWNQGGAEYCIFWAACCAAVAFAN